MRAVSRKKEIDIEERLYRYEDSIRMEKILFNDRL